MADKFNNYSSYSGTESYKYIEGLINDSKRVLVISPYIDAHYAKFLARSSKGKEIYVISSSLERGPKEILVGRKANAVVLLLIAIALILGFALLFMSYFVVGCTVLIVSVISLYFEMADVGVSNIRLKVPAHFVHAKMYIGDGKAIHGSANLTYKGMHRNIEHVELTKDPMQLKNLESQFWRLWHSL